MRTILGWSHAFCMHWRLASTYDKSVARLRVCHKVGSILLLCQYSLVTVSTSSDAISTLSWLNHCKKDVVQQTKQNEQSNSTIRLCLGAIVIRNCPYHVLHNNNIEKLVQVTPPCITLTDNNDMHTGHGPTEYRCIQYLIPGLHYYTNT